jgi:hypothetical protein
MKLELKHLAPYLPYGLKVKTKYGWDTMTTLNEFEVNGDHEESYSYEYHPNEVLELKPILRPLSYFSNWIIKDKKDFLGVNHNQMMEFLGFSDGQIKLENISLGLYLAMCNKHIDFNFLIEKGLAININKI